MLVSEIMFKGDGLPHPGLDAVGGGEGILEDGRYRFTLQFLPVRTVERAGTSHTAGTTTACVGTVRIPDAFHIPRHDYTHFQVASFQGFIT